MSDTTETKAFATGRTSEIHLLDDGRVLKLFPTATPSWEVEDETQKSIAAHEAGATPIACHGTVWRGGSQGILFDRLDGGSLTEMAEKNILLLKESGRILARVHADLHVRQSEDFIDIRERMAGFLETTPMAFLSRGQKRMAAERIAGLPGGDAVLHMDYHPNNVFRHKDGYAVIDWQTVMKGPPAADVAMTRFLMSEAEFWPGISFAQKLLYSAVRRYLLKTYLAEYRRLTGLSEEDIAAWRLPALINRLAGWDIASERHRLRAHILKLLETSP